MIRRAEHEDAPELARLLDADRVGTAVFWPELPDRLFTPAGQRERIEGALAGTIALSNLARGAFQSANVGCWVSSLHRGHGLATRAVRETAELAFGELGVPPARGGDPRREPRLAARAREERLHAT